MSRGPLCCKNFCAFCKVHRFLRQPWNCCCIAAIVSLVFAIAFIPAGLTLMGFYVDQHDSDQTGLRVLAWLGVACFATGIVLLSLGFLLWGCVWRVYQLREKTRIHLEMKQGTLYVPSAASRFNETKDSPMLPLRNLSSKTKQNRRPIVDVENINNPGDIRLTKLPSRPVSVQTFVVQETTSPTRNSFSEKNFATEKNSVSISAENETENGKSPLMTSLQRYSPAPKDFSNGPPPNFPPSANHAPQTSITKSFQKTIYSQSVNQSANSVQNV